jgi:hypothetical protein
VTRSAKTTAAPMTNQRIRLDRSGDLSIVDDTAAAGVPFVFVRGDESARRPRSGTPSSTTS